jgi:hypothetical protein
VKDGKITFTIDGLPPTSIAVPGFEFHRIGLYTEKASFDNFKVIELP